MTVPIWGLVVAGVVLLWLVFKLFEYKSKMVKPDRVYVDTSGITNNPPRFVEVLQNKTINFVVGRWIVRVAQMSIKDLTIVQRIAALYAQLQELFTNTPKNRVEEVRSNIAKDLLYRQIVGEIYHLSKHFVDKKRKYRKELFREARKNHEKVMLITEQIFDYWMYIKKLMSLLAKGGSLRQIIGDVYTWNSHEMDTNGMTIIKPRFVLSTN
jgi:hypothetical protein